MTVTKIHLIMNIKSYIGLLNLKYRCFRICVVFFKMNGQLQGSGDRGTNKCLYFSLQILKHFSILRDHTNSPCANLEYSRRDFKKETPSSFCIIIAMTRVFCMRGLKRQNQWFTVRDPGKIKKKRRDVYLKDETNAVVYCDSVIEVYKQ